MASVDDLRARIEQLDARVEVLEAQFKQGEAKAKAEAVIDADPAMDDDLNLVEQPDTQLEGEFRLQTDVWDAALFIGHKHIGVAGSFALVVLLAANLVTQTTFCWIAMDHFTKSQYGDGVTDALTWWRADAHQTQWGQEGMSLAERVCEQDPTLMVGTDVKARIKMIKEYLPEFTEHAIASGPSLCVLTLLLWYSIVSKEIYSILCFSASVLCLEKGPRTLLVKRPNKAIELAVISWGRLALAMLVALLRLATACVLVYVGTLRTAYTTTWGGILLNAVKLQLILNVDDMLFDILAPKNVKGLFQKLKPLRKPTVRTWKGWDLPSCVTLVFIAAGLVVAYVTVIMPELQHQIDAYNAVCAGDRTFLQTEHSGLVLWARGEAYEPRDPGGSLNYMAATAVVDLNGGEPGDRLVGHRLGGLDELEYVSTLTYTEIADFSNPMCRDVLDEAFDEFAPGVYNINHQAYFRASTGRDDISSCGDVAQYCVYRPGRTAGATRATMYARRFCPHVCMCGQPGALFDRTFCPPMCEYLPEWTVPLAGRPCVDGAAAELRGSVAWQSLARETARQFDNVAPPGRSMAEPAGLLPVAPPQFSGSVLAVQNLSLMEAHVSLMLELGCDYHNLTRNLLQQLGGQVGSLAINHAHCFHCPERCPCNPVNTAELLGLCPPSCPGWAELAASTGRGGAVR